MTMMDVTIGVIYQRARETSPGEGIDEHWRSVLPEAIHCVENEIFLVLHRAEVNQLMEQDAARYAQTLPPRDISNLDDGTLTLHYYTRFWLMGMSKEPLYQVLVDQSYGVVSNTRDAGRWAKPSFIWLPIPAGFHRQIYDSLVERYKHYFFAERCYAELLHRARKNPYMKHTFIHLTDDPDLSQLRNQGSAWLREASRRIATDVGAQPEVGEDAKQDWLAKLCPLSLHRQIQNLRATRKAIEDRTIDLHYRKGGKYEQVPFDEDLANTIPAESPTDSPEGIDLENLRAHQSKLEKLLSKGEPKRGKRRFRVLEMLVHTSCQQTIAKQLNVCEATITGDIKIIKKARYRIQDLLDS